MGSIPCRGVETCSPTSGSQRVDLGSLDLSPDGQNLRLTQEKEREVASPWETNRHHQAEARAAFAELRGWEAAVGQDDRRHRHSEWEVIDARMPMSSVSACSLGARSREHLV